MELSIEDLKLKDILKEAFIEAIQEREQYLRELIDEEIEDMVLAKLIERDKDSGLVDEAEVMKILKAGSADRVHEKASA